eukprot:116758_1
MLKSPQNSTVNGVRLMLLLEVLMCVVATICAFINVLDGDLGTNYNNDAFQRAVLLLLLSITSCVAVITGAIGLCGKTLCLNVFDASSVVASVVMVVYAIYVALFHVEDDIRAQRVFIVTIGGFAALRVYGNITVHKFVKSLNNRPAHDTN